MTGTLELTKHHGLGNDFLVAFVDDVPSDAAQLARALCERRTGIGADGLILVHRFRSSPNRTRPGRPTSRESSGPATGNSATRSRSRTARFGRAHV